MPLTAPTLLAHMDPAATAASMVLGVAAAGLYGFGCLRRGGASSSRASAAAVLALAAWLASVHPMLASAADRSFAWHMVQHLLFTMVVPPLVVLARPGPPVASAMAAIRRLPVVDAAFPGPARSHRRAGRRRRRSGPIVAALVSSGVLWAWHAPVLYDAAVEVPGIHALEHLTLLATFCWAWWLIVTRTSARAAGLVALSVMAIAGATLGGLLTFAPEPLYDSHHQLSDPLADQQLAGLLMWVPGGIVPLIAAVALTATSVREAAHRVRLRERTARPATSSAVVVLGLALATGAVVACSDAPSGSGGVAGADASRAPAAFDRYGCGACHVIPGTGHDGNVGPPLSDMGERAFIAGELTNTPENMVEWLLDPQAVEPGTAMPDLEVTERDARDMAAYLLQLG